MLLAAILVAAGMLWETNDLLEENQDHPWISAEHRVSPIQYDEYGDPIATSERPRELSYAKLWSSPLSRVGFTFLLALAIGSLARTLINGVLALCVVICLAVLLVGQGHVLEWLRPDGQPGFLSSAWAWLRGESGGIFAFLMDSPHLSVSAVLGGVIGLLR